MGKLDLITLTYSIQNIIPGSAERPLATLTGHSGPVVGVLLCLPLALSAAGCTVRLWDVSRGGGGGACLKLLQHGDSPVTAMTWYKFHQSSFMMTEMKKLDSLTHIVTSINGLAFWNCLILIG